MENKSKTKRDWVLKTLGDMTRGTHISNTARTKLMKKLWAEARRRYD